MADDPFEDFIGEEVVDTHGNAIGTLECYWEHDEGKPVLLGINVGETAHHTHLMPAKGARLDEDQAYVMVPFKKEKVRLAPCLECGMELDDTFENNVFAYYGENSFDYKLRAADAAKRELRRKFRDAATNAKSSCTIKAEEAKIEEPKPEEPKLMA